MDKCNNLNKVSKHLNSFIFSSTDSINRSCQRNKLYENHKYINFNNKKRNRENETINFSNNLNSFENKFLSFNQFTNKIREELRAYKSKRKFIFSDNNFQIQNLKNNNNFHSNPILLIDNNNDIYPKNNFINIDDNNDCKVDNKNYIINNKENINNYQTNKILNSKIPNDNKENYINTFKQNINNPTSSIGNNKFNTNNGIFNENKTFPIYSKREKMIKYVSISLISGMVIIGFVYFICRDNYNSGIKNVLNYFSLSSWIIIFCFILIFIVVIFVYHKNKEIYIYNKISKEDFQILKKMLYESYFKNSREYIGIFQNQFVKNCCNKRNIDEGKYIKYILPLINKLINKFNNKKKEKKIINYNNGNNDNNNNTELNFVIDEFDIIISGQKLKLWRYNELSNV